MAVAVVIPSLMTQVREFMRDQRCDQIPIYLDWVSRMQSFLIDQQSGNAYLTLLQERIVDYTDSLADIPDPYRLVNELAHLVTRAAQPLWRAAAAEQRDATTALARTPLIRSLLRELTENPSDQDRPPVQRESRVQPDGRIEEQIILEPPGGVLNPAPYRARPELVLEQLGPICRAGQTLPFFEMLKVLPTAADHARSIWEALCAERPLPLEHQAALLHLFDSELITQMPNLPTCLTELGIAAVRPGIPIATARRLVQKRFLALNGRNEKIVKWSVTGALVSGLGAMAFVPLLWLPALLLGALAGYIRSRPATRCLDERNRAPCLSLLQEGIKR